MEQKKILILINNSVGLYIFRGALIGALAKDHTVAASTPDNGFFPELEALGCRVIETPVDRRGVNPATDLKLLLRYRKMLKAERPDLVITYTVKPNVYGGLACRLAGIPYAANITGLGTAFQKQGFLRKLVVFLYKTGLKKAKVVFFENSANRQIFIDEGIVQSDKCCLLAGAGVDLERFTPAPYPEEGPVRFLFMGRVMEEKGVRELFGAMERLRNEGFDCTLDVLGEYEEDFSGAIRSGEEAGWLRFRGYQTDIRPFVAAAHCFVLPSYHEGMANTNLECAAMARPLITSNIPGCREAVIEGESGLLCRPQDTDSLYDAMKAFLALPHPRREAMGTAGRTHMETVFDKQKVVEQTIAALS